jgi:hypothetical protein
MKFRLLGPSTGRAIALCVSIFAAISSSQLLAQINFNDFSNTTGLQFNGVAAQATNGSNQKVLRLTPDGTQSAAGSTWFTTRQPVAAGFTSTFTFQVTSANGAADGFAFVIQNTPSSPLGAIGAGAGGLGYGQGGNPGGIAGNGIQNSLAIEFDTFQNVWGDPDGDHVAVQSCANNVQQAGPPTVPMGSNNQFHVDVDSNFNPVSQSENPVAFTSCTVKYGDSQQAIVSLGSLNQPLTIADGQPHTVTVDYETNCDGEICSPTLDVVISGRDLFPGGIPIDLNSQLNLPDGGTAYVGFTGGTGGSTENGDILNWTFTPHTSVTVGPKPTPPGQTTVFSFGAFNFKATPDLTTKSGNSLTVTASVVPAGTGVTFTSGTGATCIPYGSTGGNCETFEVVCSGPDCGGTYDAEFATSYDLIPGQTTVIAPGFGKFHTGSANECALPLTGPFTNQIDAFFVQRIDPTTKGKSGGTASCWVATQNTPGISNSVSNFIGFNAPVTNTAVNLAKAGQAIPLSFEVLDQNSVPVSNLTLCTQANPASCPAGSVDIMDNPSGCSVDGDTTIGAVVADVTGGSGLQSFGGGSYQFNWKTSKAWAGTCRTIQVNLLDGINHIAVFKFK